jgi:ActR/RegA family two-component response regulator
MSRIDFRVFDPHMHRAGVSTRAPVRDATTVLVEDEPLWSEAIEDLCAFLEVQLARVSSTSDIAAVLRDQRPMAVLANMEAAGQDGCHVMKLVAAHDPDLPMMVFTGGDAALAGAADAIEEVWGLTSVVTRDTPPSAGEVVEFLFRAGRRGRCMGLLPV